jgi:tetratricopeptide (TPR) repeat protein
MTSFSLRTATLALPLLCNLQLAHADPQDKKAAPSAAPATPAASSMTKSQKELAAAVLMLEHGRPDLACRLLQLTPKDSTDADRLHVLARCSAELKQVDAAIDYYKRTIALRPKAPRPRAELAALYTAMEEYGAARQLISETAYLMPPGQAAQAMKNLAEQLGTDDPAAIARRSPAKPWSIELYGGVIYDDNVNGGPVSNVVPAVVGGTPVSFTLAPGAMPRSSSGLVGSIGGSYVVPLNQQWRVLYQGALTGTGYFSESDFSNNSLSLSAALIYRNAGTTASVQSNVRYQRMDGRMQEALPGVVARFSKTLTPMWTATASAGYFKRSVHPDMNRDANGRHGSLGLIAQMSNSLQIGGEYEVRREEAKQDVYSRRLHGPSLFAVYRTSPVFTLIGNYSYSKVEHDARMALFPNAREDRQKTAALTALWDVSTWAGRNMIVRAQYMNVANASNIAYSDFKRNLLTVGVQTQF